MLFVVLTALPDAASASLPAGKAWTPGSREYMVAFLVLETMMIGVFCQRLILVLFYVLVRSRA